MKIQQKQFTKADGWKTLTSDSFDPQACNLVLVFANPELLGDATIYGLIKLDYPNADILLSSTAGEIMDVVVSDGTISLTAIAFEKTVIKTAAVQIKVVENSYEAGKQLGQALDPVNLKNVFVISDGQLVNGSELVLGLENSLPPETIITGGLAGDSGRFEKTMVGLNETPLEGRIAAIGFYGDNLTITYGSIGGWDPFGPERLITKSKANVLHELDGKPALDIYKAYLGEYASELPGSALSFPLSIQTNGPGSALVRTILSVSESDKSLTFAGNMPEGTYARLMKANCDGLIEGASGAAQNSVGNNAKSPGLAILISCVGRKLVLNQRVDEEIEAVRAIYGDKTVIAGFYSYGEISPTINCKKCELHNQTMTITTFTEE